MQKKDLSERLIEEYRGKYELYTDFCATIGSILETILKGKEFRYQIVSYRAKKLTSAVTKLRDKTCKKLDDLTDLAGCRVIFYLESDINKFLHEIYTTFGRENILEHENKISKNSYNAIHLIICLGESRLVHPEYSRFTKLKCEIQLTTVLHHAWSEMEHDIVYKPEKELSGFDERAFEALKRAFGATMEDYIQPAVRSFEYIFGEYEKLKAGKGVFDVTFLSQIEQSKSNNEIRENLKLLLEYVRKFGDKAPKELGLIPLIKKVLVNSKKIKKENIKTVFGKLRGSSYEEVALTALEILSSMRYRYTKEVCEICFELIRNERGQKVVNKAAEVLSHICKYDLEVLKKIGYYPQITALAYIESSGILDESKALSAIAKMLQESLSFSFSGTKLVTFNTFSFQSGSLKGSPSLRAMRKKALGISKKLYKKARNIKEKREVIRIFEEATRWPDQGAPEGDREFENIMAEDIKDILSFYAIVLKNDENEAIQEIEKHLAFLERNPRQKTPRTLKLLTLIAKDQEYQTFKVFVGHDLNFFPDFDFEKAATYRSGKLNEYSGDISAKNLPRWINTFKKITKNHKYSEAGAYNNFNSFLFKLGKEKPELALQLINEKALESFLIHLVAGIWKSPQKNKAKNLIRKWTHEYKHFRACASVFDYVEEIDRKIFKEVVTRAINKKDAAALNSLIASIGRNYKSELFLRKTFLDIIKTLTELGNTYWVNHIWFRQSTLLKDLNKADFRIVLDNLLHQDRIEYHTEEILLPVAEKYPKDLVGFFLARVERTSKKKRNEFPRYDPIPSDFHKLGEALKKQARIVVPLVLKWYSLPTIKKDKWRYQWEASQLLTEIFPNSDPILEEELIKIIQKGGKEGRDIFDSIFSQYEGQDFLWKLIDAIVKAYKNKKDYTEIKSSLFGYLSQTGVVSGEYGLVNAYTRKKEALQGLKSAAGSDLLSFIEEYEDSLDGRIAGAQKMADDELDRRKREFTG